MANYGFEAPKVDSLPQSGIIGNALNQQTTVTTPSIATPPSVSQSNTTWTAPVQRTVDSAKETVQGQMSGLMAADSPYMTQARTRAAQAANARGLLNSSMAVGAGEQAAYDAALPIAQADAQIYGNAANLNTQTTNQSLAQRDSDMNKNAMFNAGESNKILLQQLDQQTKLDLANVESSYKTLMQANASAGELYQQAVKNITDLINNKDLTDATARQTAINQQVAMLKTGLGLFGGMNNLNLAGLLDFSGVPGYTGG